MDSRANTHLGIFVILVLESVPVFLGYMIFKYLESGDIMGIVLLVFLCVVEVTSLPIAIVQLYEHLLMLIHPDKEINIDYIVSRRETKKSKKRGKKMTLKARCPKCSNYCEIEYNGTKSKDDLYYECGTYTFTCESCRAYNSIGPYMFTVPSRKLEFEEGK